jgi:ADP-heptose:LPS heptosyltransferase
MAFYAGVNRNKHFDLRRESYYVVAPFSNASLRSMPYSTWLETIKQLAARKKVVVVGTSKMRLPDVDFSAGTFISQLNGIPNVVNAVDKTPVRVLMALISNARAVVCLDSAPLYIAQALRTPAISIWGSHDPGVRIGYDPEYMRHALWNQEACIHAPCYAYSQFPAHKCPAGVRQNACDVLVNTTCNQVLALMDSVESMERKTNG